jgi:hypothetical protein
LTPFQAPKFKKKQSKIKRCGVFGSPGQSANIFEQGPEQVSCESGKKHDAAAWPV